MNALDSSILHSNFSSLLRSALFTRIELRSFLHCLALATIRATAALQGLIFMTKSNTKKRKAATPQPKRKPLNRFEVALERISQHQDYRPQGATHAPYGFFLDRPIISEHGPFNGGVYISADPSEALVVDDRFGELLKLYDEFLLQFVREHPESINTVKERELMREIFQFTQRKLRYVSPTELEALAIAKGITIDQKVSLEVFIQLGIGTDRHQILLAAYLLEKCRHRNLLGGTLFLNTRYDNTLAGAESLIYTSPSTGEIFTFTPGERRFTANS